MNKGFRGKNKGITLIALVISIVVLLILAGVTISMLAGDNGILANATFAKFATEVKSIEEQIQLKIIMSDSNYSGSINDLLEINSNYNDKLLVEEGELKYIANNSSSKEIEWFEKLGIGKASDYYIITFNSFGGTEIIAQTIKAGETVSKPTDPTKSGYIFIEWYYLLEGGTSENVTYTEIEFDFNTEIMQDYTLYARYYGEAIMMARNENIAFWKEDYRTNITSITFEKGEIEVPSTAVESWDIKSDDNCSEVRAYIEENENSQYKLTIISPHTIFSNVNMDNFFYNFYNLETIDFANLDTSRTRTMNALFKSCKKLIKLDLRTFNTDEVYTIHGMFWDCNNLTELNISSFNTYNVKDMRYVFYGCSNLTELDISNFDTSNVTTMRHMFTLCESLTSLNLSNFNTIKVEDMAAMFQACTNLKIILVGNNWTMEQVSDVSNMFLRLWYKYSNNKLVWVVKYFFILTNMA